MFERLTRLVQIPDKEQKLNKFLFSYFFMVPQNVLWRPWRYRKEKWK